jgi:hypothetical protein
MSELSTENLIKPTYIHYQRFHKKRKFLQPSSFLRVTQHNHKKTEYICPLVQIDDKNEIGEIEFLDIKEFKIPTDLSTFTSLTGLSLHFLNLTIFPDEICELTNLRKLSLSFNKLKDLPTDSNRLSSLSDLRISHNFLEKVPSVIFELQDLRTLKLKHNELRLVDCRIARLHQLEKLNLCDNRPLKYFPYRLFTINHFSSDLQGLKYGGELDKTEYKVNSLFHLAATSVIKKIYHRFPIKRDNLQVEILKKSLLPDFIKESLFQNDYWFCDKCNWIQFGSTFVSVFRHFHGSKIFTDCSIDLTIRPRLVYNFCSTYCLSEWLWKNKRYFDSS